MDREFLFDPLIPDYMFIDDSITTMTAFEAATTVPPMGINGEPMKIYICTDEIITKNKLKRVSNPVSFVKDREPTMDGIYSETIFGTTQNEKYLNHAYIELNATFFHPYVYEVLCQLHTKIPKICEGESYWTIKNGEFVEIVDETDPNYKSENTGLQFVIDNFDKLRFSKNDSIGHNDKVKFIKTLDKNEIFITKWIVIPLFYRDITSSGTMTSVSPINMKYTKLISLCNSLQTGIYGYTANKTLNVIQQLLVDIRKTGQELIEKKNGILHRSVLGKNSMYGVRGVISVPSLVGCDYPEDRQVNMLTSGFPLSMCIQAGYPYVLKYILDWIEQNLRGGKITTYRKNDKGVLEPHEGTIKDHTIIFNKEYIDKVFKKFMNGFGGRWEPIVVETEDGEKCYLTFTGQGYASKAGDEGAATIVNRPFTWCDLIYMAAEDTLSDKHIYCTRYPVEDYFNMTPSRLSVLSTIKTMKMKVGNKVYKHYPVIDPFADEITVSRSFIDTISVSNLHLAGYRGDYDGDTLSGKLLFTLEANEETEEKIHSLTHYLTVNGDLIRTLGNEALLCMYNMTRKE